MDRMTIGEFARESRLSPKALRLYDEMGVLVPAHVDPSSGYRLYDPAQLESARLVASLRQLGMPLAQIRDLAGRPDVEIAALVGDYWAQAELGHESRRELARYLVDALKGTHHAMPDVTTLPIPERSMLCLKRHCDAQAVWDLGKEFIGILKAHPMPRVPGDAGAAFLIYHGEVSDDSDGPVEWCRPIPDEQVDELAAACPELVLRREPAHEEAWAYVGAGAEIPPARWQVVSDELRRWADAEQRLPSELGVRVIYAFGAEGPDLSFAVPLQ